MVDSSRHTPRNARPSNAQHPGRSPVFRGWESVVLTMVLVAVAGSLSAQNGLGAIGAVSTTASWPATLGFDLQYIRLGAYTKVIYEGGTLVFEKFKPAANAFDSMGAVGARLIKLVDDAGRTVDAFYATYNRAGRIIQISPKVGEFKDQHFRVNWTAP